MYKKKREPDRVCSPPQRAPLAPTLGCPAMDFPNRTTASIPSPSGPGRLSTKGQLIASSSDVSKQKNADRGRNGEGGGAQEEVSTSKGIDSGKHHLALVGGVCESRFGVSIVKTDGRDPARG